MSRRVIYAHVIGLSAYVVVLISLYLGWRQVDTPFILATFGCGVLVMDLIHGIIRNLETQLRDMGGDPDELYKQFWKRDKGE